MQLSCTEEGFIYYEITQGRNTSEDIIKFFERLKIKILENKELKLEYEKGRLWLFLDNATIHTSKIMVQFLKSSGLNILYPPPYSPEVNLSEFIFASIKNSFRNEVFYSK